MTAPVMRALKHHGPAILFVLGLLGFWQGLAELQLISPVFFPAPSRALSELAAKAGDGSLWESLAATLSRMLAGWLLSALVGIALGAAIGSSRLARDLLGPILEFMRPLPASAIIPVAILFLGLSSGMALVVIAFGAIWPVLLGAAHGFASSRNRLKEVAAALEFGSADWMWKFALPAALPDIISGLRISLAIALILAVVTEMQASLPGLGFDIFMAQRSFRSAELYAGLIVLGVVGFIVNHGLALLEGRLLSWREPRS
jgi:sulfonate transport system permease protein